MSRIRLFSFKACDVEGKAMRLRSAGYDVAAGPPAAMAELRELGETAAVVIDLDGQPSAGRDLALFIRKRKSTRALPLVMAGGAAEKLPRIKEHLPDAVYTSWRGIRGAIKRAIANPPADPRVPESTLAGYSGTPLVKKLGIKAHSSLVLAGAPVGFLESLSDLPQGVSVRRRNRGKSDRIIWFVKSRHGLDRGLLRMRAALAPKGGLWIAWPKKTSALTSDLTQRGVREAGLAAGLVDYKICAIDATWSALLFARRKQG